MEETNKTLKQAKTLPRSKKALEYRVFWLERKLSHLKEDSHRGRASVVIDKLPDSGNKHLLHLNNEFFRAVELSESQGRFTESVNQDSRVLNERSERLNEISQKKISDTDHLNKQTRRVIEQSHELNQASTQATRDAEQTTTKAKLLLIESQLQGDETRALQQLSRSQYAATKSLDTKVNNTHRQTIKTNADSQVLNRQLSDEIRRAQTNQRQAAKLQAELNQIKSELAQMAAITEQLQSDTRSDLKNLAQSKLQNEKTIEHSRQVTAEAKKQIKLSQRQIDDQSQLCDLTAEKITELAEIQCQARNTLLNEQYEHERLRAEIEADTRHLRKTTEARLAVESQAHHKTIQLSLDHHRETLDNATEQMASDAISHQQALSHSTHKSTEQAINQAQHRTDNAIEALTLQTLDSLDRFDVESTSQLNEFVQASGETLETFKDQAQIALDGLDTSVSSFHESSNESLARFIDLGDQQLTHSKNQIHQQSQQFDDNLTKSQSFLTEAGKINDQSAKVIDEARQLNITNAAMEERCKSAMTDITAILQEIGAARSHLETDHQQLNAVTQSLNTESSRLQQVTLEVNSETIKLQNDSVNTQELSQQINSHSLALHQETRDLNQSFDQVKQENQVLIEHLSLIEQRLNEQHTFASEQIAAMERGVRKSDVINETTESLQDITKQLTDETHLALAEAKRVIKDTENAKQSTLSLTQDIHQAYVKLSLLEDEVKHAGEESRAAAQEAWQSVAESKQLQEILKTNTRQFHDLRLKAETEFSQLVTLKKDATSTTEQSNLALGELQKCITDSRHINDEFLRGLEAASESHKIGEANSQALMEETSRLQVEIKDILSLREGLHGFQQNISNCQARLDQYQSSLSNCEQVGVRQEQMLDRFQGKIDHYQSDLKSHKDNISRFSTRTDKLENEFESISFNLEQLKEDQDSQQAQLLKQQQQALQSLKTEIEDDLLSRKQQLDVTQRQMEAFSVDLASKLKAEVRRQTSDTEQKVNQAQLDITRISTGFDEMKTTISSEVKHLKSESTELRQQNRELLQQHQLQQSEFVAQQNGHELEIEEIKHRLKNYQGLLQNQIDMDRGNHFDDRMASLESTAENQRESMHRLEDFQTQLIEQDPEGQLKEFMTKFGRSMDDATKTNLSLKDTISDVEKTNKNLMVNNQRLQQKLALALKERDHTLKQYADRIQHVEEKEEQHHKSITNLRAKEAESNDTLYQMRLAMKDSTDAMRETQRTIATFQDALPKQTNWLSSSKQAVVNSFIGILVISVGMLGYDRVDAAISEPAHSIASVAQTPLEAQRQVEPRQNATSLALQSAIANENQEAKGHAKNSIVTLGKFSWPVNYGIVDPSDIRYEPHRGGISIGAELGDPVVAVNDGTVLYSANEIRGYGNVIVIQHDQDLVSVYANNQFNYVKRGDEVKRGQLIGDIGQLFDLDEAGLYFEMRYRGAAEDPFNYISQSDQQVSSLTDSDEGALAFLDIKNQRPQLSILANRG